MSRVYLIDASVYVFRAWFSVAEAVTDTAGRQANAVHGYGQFLCDLLERHRPDYIACAFDASLTSSFRNDIYAPYKANRPLPPPELERQFIECRALTEALGITALKAHRYEADDIIGTLAASLRNQVDGCVFVTADKDYAQLLSDGDYWWDAGRDRWLDCSGTAEHIGVAPEQVADWLALAGDSIDNIPGVPGIGAKTAAVLLRELGSLDAIYERLDAVPALSLRGAARVQRLLEAHQEQAWLSRELSRIYCQTPIDTSPGSVVWQGVSGSALERLWLPVQLNSRCRRLPGRYEEVPA
jgi:5'-3' exonuclease